MRNASESELISRLEGCETCLEYFSVVSKAFNEQCRNSLPGVFVQDDEIHRYAVQPLLEKGGPLDKIDVKLKLMYALGKIKQHTYTDIDTHLQFYHYLLQEEPGMDFEDEMVFELVTNLSIVKQEQAAIYLNALNSIKQQPDIMDLQITRYRSVIKTILSLSVVSIMAELALEQERESCS